MNPSLSAVWANNRGGNAADPVLDVRLTRQADLARSTAKWERVGAAAAAEDRSEQEIREGLLAQLELPR